MGWAVRMVLSNQKRVMLLTTNNWLGVFLLVVITMVSTRSVLSQDTTPVGGLTNFAFLNYYGTGTFETGGQKVLVIRIPPALTLRSLEQYPWGLRAKLAFVFAIQDFETLDDITFDKYRVFTFVPGIEMLIPVGEIATLRPYFDFGVGVDDETNQFGLIAGLGIKTEFIFLANRWRMSLEPGAQMSTSRPIDGPDVRDNYSEIWLKGTARHPLWFKMGDAQPDAGVYAEVSNLFDTLEFRSITGETTKIRALFEVGVSLGFQYPRPAVLFVRIPTVSVGYRFGKDFQGLTIRFGGDLATPISSNQR